MIDNLHSSVIELDSGNFISNADFFRALIGEKCRLSFVIKGNAYGHRIEDMVPVAEKAGIDHFSVFSSDEACRALKVKSNSSHIMIMGFIDDENIPWAIENGISFYVSSLDRLKAAVNSSSQTNREALIHLELETGFHRTGLEMRELPEAAELIINASGRIRIAGTATHYAGAESIANYYRIRKQIDRFHEMCRTMSSLGLETGLRHSACSAATLTYPETRMDMVRIGISLYGFWPTNETKMNYLLNYCSGDETEILKKEESPLKRVLSWKTRVMSLQKVSPGQFVGYGNSCLTTVPSLFAAVPVGYSHGFSRDLSNCGYVLIRGRRAPVAGVVNMNMLLANVTDIEGVERGDEVVIIGCQKDREITVSSFSALSQYLNYEVLVQIPPDIPRVVI